MKRILLALILILIVGCQAPQQAEDPGSNLPSAAQEDAISEASKTPVVQIGVPAEIKDLLEKSKTRTKSLSYNYKGPEHETDLFRFFVKEDRIKYLPPRGLKSLDSPDAFDSVFIDKEAKTAAQYCEAAHCRVRGKKMELDYDEAYIKTPFDWALGIGSAKKIGEEVIESRSTWKIETNKGMMWIDSFYGIPMKVESDGNEYKFSQIAFNQVEDSDVVPSE